MAALSCGLGVAGRGAAGQVQGEASLERCHVRPSCWPTPTFSYGDVATCLLRGDGQITGLSGTPIPWPIGHSLTTRRPGLLVFGDLAEALRHESAQAVQHFWGVGQDTA